MELIELQSGDAARYEKLLLRRDALKKEAEGYLTAYIREFGPLIVRLHQKEVDCIRIKKAIVYCQLQVNRGLKINLDEMQRYIKQMMEQYEKDLDNLIRDVDACKRAQAVPEQTRAKAKMLYRKIAKRLHPDMNPGVEQDETLMELWNRVVDAYRMSNVEDLEELGVLVESALSEKKPGQGTVKIPQLEEKIERTEQQIRTILETDPYQYKFLITDETLMEEVRRGYEEKLREYEEYEQELKKVQQSYLQQGVILPWQES